MGRSRWTAGDSSTALPLRVLANLYVAAFGRKAFYGWNQRLLNLSLRGMGIGNPTTNLIASAEAGFIRRMVGANPLTVFDVGAHNGDYAEHIRRLSPEARIWCFEPHPGSFERLQAAAAAGGFTAVNVALSDITGRARLYDYAATAASGSSHATMHAGVIDVIHRADQVAIEVDVMTLDGFVQRERIERINLLKIDAEGSELAILRGAQQTISRRGVDVVQFEFNEMNAISRVFFKDFYDALPGFTFYRMLSNGLVPIGEYRPRTHEVFVLQNVVAVRDDLEYRSRLA